MIKNNTFSKRLKKGLVNNESAKFIYLNNFEVEEKWNVDQDIFKFPTITIGNSDVIVNRMEELGLLLATSNDFIVLKEEPDLNFLNYLKEIGFQLPQIISVGKNDPKLNITENILQCKNTINKLKELRAPNVYFMTFGTSELEEKLSDLTGIPIATPPAAVLKKVNNKIFSREINDENQIRQIPGYNCKSINDLEEGFRKLKPHLNLGGKLIIKDAMGVSGKGLVIIDSERKFNQYVKLIRRHFNKNAGIKTLHMVMEKFIDKQCDLNYQFLISEQGNIDFHFVKESIVENGVHQGHIMPSRLNVKQLNELKTVATILGKELYKSGYFGIVGVDAILSKNGILYPNLEINARFNMSTYQTIVQEMYIGNQKVAIAKKADLALFDPLMFSEFRRRNNDLFFTPSKGTGLLVTNFATVNASSVLDKRPYEGRLYYMIIEDTLANALRLESNIAKRLLNITGG